MVDRTMAIKSAHLERKERLAFQVIIRDRLREAHRFLEQEVWPVVPKAALGRRLTRREEDRLLGFGSEGVWRALTLAKSDYSRSRSGCLRE